MREKVSRIHPRNRPNLFEKNKSGETTDKQIDRKTDSLFIFAGPLALDVSDPRPSTLLLLLLLLLVVVVIIVIIIIIIIIIGHRSSVIDLLNSKLSIEY